MNAKKLTDAEIHQKLPGIAGWTSSAASFTRISDARICRCFSKMTVWRSLGILNHHPEWFNVWNSASISIPTA
jgi:pterin-4a-carbinolamine dehydratase